MLKQSSKTDFFPLGRKPARKCSSVARTILLRVALVAVALMYVLPNVGGIRVHGDLQGALLASVVFNAVFWGLECLLAVVKVGVNVGTLGLGVFMTSSLKFLAALLSPALALVGTAQVLPGYLQIGSYFPGAVCAGLVLGGTMWVSFPAAKTTSKKEAAT